MRYLATAENIIIFGQAPPKTLNNLLKLNINSKIQRFLYTPCTFDFSEAIRYIF
jgi:hypothetical protein